MLFRCSSAPRSNRPRPQTAANQSAANHAALSVAAGLALLLTGGSTAWSQEDTVYVGGGQRGSVQIDMSVLDELGGAPRAGQGGSGRVVLRPPSPQSQPRAATPRSATAAKPATPPKAPAATTRTAKTTRAALPAPPRAEAPAAPPQSVQRAAPPPMPEPSSPMPETNSAMSDSIAAPSETPANRSAAAAKTAAPAAASAAMAAPETPGAAASIMRTTESIAPVPAPPEPRAAAVPAVATPTAPPPPSAIAPAIPEPEKMPAPPTQTAALAPPAAATTGGARDLRIPFGGEAAVLTDPVKGELKQLAGTLAKDQALRVQVKAYASGSEDASKARRLSLSRALAVRTYLIEQGIGSTRIDVRALGNNAEGGPSDRVDLVVVTR